MGTKEPLVGLVMGSRSDWECMQETARLLEQLEIPYEAKVVSAHRTPAWLTEYAHGLEHRGIKVVIAAAGGAAHLPGMMAAQTAIPVIGVPIQSRVLQGVDSLLSIVQMPAGIPVATMSIGVAGAKNAALFAAAMLALEFSAVGKQLSNFRNKQTQAVLDDRELSLKD